MTDAKQKQEVIGMVERVARAIVFAQLSRQYVGKIDAVGAAIEVDVVWPEFIPEARAAIEAMRLPTDAMDEAGQNIANKAYLDPELPADALFVWQAMVDAALNEQVAG